MTNIKLDSKVMSNLKSENLIAMLNEVIDSELDKDTSQVNTSLVEECIDAILQIEQDEDSSFRVLVPLMRSDDFVRKIMPKESIVPWKRLNIFARIAIVAAIVATGTFSVNAAVKSITDYDFIEHISNRITTLFDSNSDDENDSEKTNSNKSVASESKTTVTESDLNTETATVKNDGAFVTGDPITTTGLIKTEEDTEKQGGSVSTTAKKSTEKTTIPSEYVETTVPNGQKNDSGKQLTGLYVNSSNMKTAYIFGEELSYQGLVLKKIFDDGSTELLSYKDCVRTSNFDTSRAGDYTVKIVYKNIVAQISVTVRPTEDTRFSEICSNDEYDYFLTEKGAIITKYKGNSQSIILDNIDGNDVYSVEHGVYKDSRLISFSSNSCQKIMDSAFENSNLLTSVNVPNCSYIGAKAFRKTNITNITVPSGVTQIKEYTFDGCENLTDVELKGNVTAIGKCAFNECVSLESITGTAKIQRVEAFAFYDDRLMEIDSTLDDLTYAGDYAFAYCNKAVLDTIDKLTYIGDGAFMYCYNISSVHIGNGIDAVPAEAFRNTRITELKLDEGVTSIGNYAFMSTKITELQLPDSLKSIGTYAFFTNKLTEIKGGDNVESIGSLAFYPSKGLTMYVKYKSALYYYAKDNNIAYVEL